MDQRYPVLVKQINNNRYIVTVNGAKATLSHGFLGYSIEGGSTIVKDVHNITSPIVLKERDRLSLDNNLKDVANNNSILQLSILSRFNTLSDALEMIAGRPINSPPTIDDLLSGDGWLENIEIIPESKDIDRFQVNDENTKINNISEASKSESNTIVSECDMDINKTEPSIDIYELFKNVWKYNFNNDFKIPFSEGIFVIFDKNELYGNYNRIIYVGGSKKNSSLRNEVNKIINGDKNKSELRKAIGTSMLVREKDSYLRIWLKNSAGEYNLRKLGTYYDKKHENEIESSITEYIKEHFYICCININVTEKIEQLIKHIVNSLRLEYQKNKPSNEWIGCNYPSISIANIGMWQVGSSDGELFDTNDFEMLEMEIKKCWGSNSLLEYDNNQSKTGDSNTVSDSESIDNNVIINHHSAIREVLLNLNMKNSEAAIYSILLFNNNISKANIRQISSNKSIDYIQEGIQLLLDRKFISMYNEKNSKGRLTTYYQLYLPLNEVCSVFNTEITDLERMMKDSYNIVNSEGITYSNSNKISKILFELGIDYDVSKTLVFLSLNRVLDLVDITRKAELNDPRKILSYLNELERMGWIKSYEIYSRQDNAYLKSKNRERRIGTSYSLKKSIPEIILEYINLTISREVEALKLFINFCENKKKEIFVEENDVDSIVEYTGDRRHALRGRSSYNYNEEFYNAIKEKVKSHSALADKPVIFELYPPYPSKIRVYTYKISRTRRPNNQYECKCVLHVPGQSSGEIGELDFTGVTFVVICGYDVENSLFVMWDALSHKKFSNNANIQVNENALFQASIYGKYAYNRTNKSDGNEIVAISNEENLLDVIIEHYERYRDKLLGGI